MMESSQCDAFATILLSSRLKQRKDRGNGDGVEGNNNKVMKERNPTTINNSSKERHVDRTVVDCPVCDEIVPTAFINSHLDKCCITSSSSSSSMRTLGNRAGKLPPRQRSMSVYLDSAQGVHKSPAAAAAAAVVVVYDVFHLHFPLSDDTSMSSIPMAFFTHDKPPSNARGGFKAVVKWREEKVDMLITSNLSSASSEDIRIAFANTVGCRYGNIPYLKSHVQKCVRRGKASLAVATAWQLYLNNPDELLRRLPVLMIEDALLHVPSFPIIVWLMVASSKGFVLPVIVIEYLLGFVHHLAASRYKDIDRGERPVNLEAADMLTSVPRAFPWHRVMCLSTEERDALISMRLRRSYGGMAGDKLRFDRFGDIWLHRFEMKDPVCCKASYPQQLMPITLSRVKDLYLPQWDLAAIDFHVSPVVRLMRQIFESNIVDNAIIPNEPELRQLIWDHSSGITNKVSPFDDCEHSRPAKNAYWEDVLKNIFLNVTRELLRENHSKTIGHETGNWCPETL